VRPPAAPGSVRVALGALVVAIGLLAWMTTAAARAGGGPGWVQIAFAGLVGLLLLAGVATRQRLAWQWGHALPFFLALLQAAALAVEVYRRRALPLPFGPVSAVVTLALLAAWWSLGRPSALAWFDLLCPECGKPSRLGADFLFRKARCRSCGNVW
jgi:hypothetical protein